MPKYEFSAQLAGGVTTTGALEAKSEHFARVLLEARGLSSIVISKKKAPTGKVLGLELTSSSRSKKIQPRDLAIMSRQMATMIAAGLPLLRTLRTLSQQTENKKLANVLDQTAVDVEAGIGLSASLAKHPEVIPKLMVSLIAAGERGGFLDQALENIAITLERDAELRATVKSALAYPVAVLGLAVIAVIAMLIWVVPVFEKMFDDLGGTLPLPTQFLVWLSPIAAWSSPLLVIGALLFGRWWSKNKNAEWIRKLVDPLKLKLPVVGQITQKIVIARFSRNLQSLVGAGVPMLQALGLVADTAGNYPMNLALIRVQESVRLGSTIAVPMGDEQIFPPMVTKMVAVGEESGTLSQMLGKIADFYDAEVKAATNQLTSLIEPLMVAFVGILVGAMVISLYLPIFSIFGEIG
jgi:type IV pilus assembly protein PilC